MSTNLTEEGLIHVPGLLSRWVRLGTGAKAHYMTAGETGPTVILLHGGSPGSSGTAGFRFTASFLGANGFRVYCPDMPGFGWSDTNPAYWPKNGVLDHVDFIDRLADALCLDQFHLSGNSMGCINASHWWNAVPQANASHDVNLALSTHNRIDRLDVPGIYLYGVDDFICPVALGYKQEDALPKIQFFYVKDCGHQGQTDRPDIFNPVFLEFFRDGKVSRATADLAGVSKRRPEIAEQVEQ
jgi:pimeloyl-ACP methyl ester carboxylesterase